MRARYHGGYYLDSRLVHNNLVIACFNKTPAKVFQLLPSLHEQISTGWRKSHRNTFPSIPSPYVKARVAGTAVNSQEVEIRVEASKNGVLFTVFHKIRSRRGQEVGTKRDGEDDVEGTNE
jgi:hypothetical protein